MSFRKGLTIGSAAIVLAWGAALAQQAPGSPTPAQSPAQNPPSSTQYPVTPQNSATTNDPSVSASSANVKSQKPKHWSGDLVDVSCMAKALSNQNTQNPNNGAGPGAGSAVPQHFAAPSFAGQAGAGQAGQQSSGAITPGAGSPQAPGTAPAYPGQQGAPANPDMSPEQTAAMARASKVDNAAKQCVPSSSTQIFGLAMSSGQVVKFDSDGNSKAEAALKQVEVQPGKKVKAKVTGTMQNASTVKVADVEVKGKRAGGTAGAGR